MRTRFLRGTTDENNGLTLPSGELSIDSEKKALRLHDGSTLGGFEIVGIPVDLPVPGSDTLIAGDGNRGFYGEVTPDEFITPEELSLSLGISEGTLVTNINWLKFSLDNKKLFVAKKNIRLNISYNTLSNVNAILGDKIMEIRGNSYKLRLLEAYDNFQDKDNGEFARLFWTNGSTPPTDLYGYSNEELDTASSPRNSSWCQEYFSGNDGRYITMGYVINAELPTSTNPAWRPVLELIE